MYCYTLGNSLRSNNLRQFLNTKFKLTFNIGLALITVFEKVHLLLIQSTL